MGGTEGDWRSVLGSAEPTIKVSEPEPGVVVPVDAVNEPAVQLVVADDREPAGQANLPAVRMAGKEQVRVERAPFAVPVGDAGVAVSGVTPDGTKSATALLFRQDRALVRIDFYTTLGAVTPLDTVVDIGQKQTVALRAGLPAVD